MRIPSHCLIIATNYGSCRSLSRVEYICPVVLSGHLKEYSKLMALYQYWFMHERKGINYIEANQLTITKILYNFFMLEAVEMNLRVPWAYKVLTILQHNMHHRFVLAFTRKWAAHRCLRKIGKRNESAKLHSK